MISSTVKGLCQFLNRQAIIWISVPFIVGLGIQATFKSSSEWMEVFVPAARTLWSGSDLYSSSGYMYPPFMALMIVPFGRLPELAARLGWFAVNVACIAGLVKSAWLLAGGPAIQSIDAENRRDWAAAGAGIACSASYVLNALAHQQVDIIIDFLAVAGCLLLVRTRSIGGATLIGLAAACKGPPLLFSAYLIFRRQWLAAGLIVFVAVGVNLLPDLIIPASGGELRLVTWVKRFVVPTFSGQLGAWNGLGTANQSLAGTAQRILTTALQPTPSGLDLVHGYRQVSEPLIKATAYGFILALLAISVIAGLRGQTFARGVTGVARLPSHTALELSAVSLLMLLMSPMSDLAHLGIVVLPAFCLARIAIFRSGRMIGASIAIAAVGALTVNKDLIGEPGYTIVLWAGVATWSMLVLWAGCIVALAQGLGEPPVSGFASSIFSIFRPPFRKS